MIKNKKMTKEEKEQEKITKEYREDREAFLDLLLERMQETAKFHKNKDLLYLIDGFLNKTTDSHIYFFQDDYDRKSYDKKSAPMCKPTDLFNANFIEEESGNEGFDVRICAALWDDEKETHPATHPFSFKVCDGYTYHDVLSVWIRDASEREAFDFGALMCSEIKSLSHEVMRKHGNSFDKVIKEQKPKLEKRERMRWDRLLGR